MQSLESTPIRVFLVDDHKTVLWGLERLVESTDARMRVVGTAADCDEMFAKLPGARPDVILLDLDLGGFCALDCLQELKAQSPAKALIITGSTDPSVHRRAVAQGARGVVHKHVLADVLLLAIESVHHGEIWLDHAAIGGVATRAGAGGTGPQAEDLAELTQKEREIVHTIVELKGARNQLIAAKLHMSEHTLRNHLTSIYGKLGLAGRMELYIYATGLQEGTGDTDRPPGASPDLTAS